ncbi:MAG: hypothetical protein ACEPOW_02645 [Bacteroidales bacterium]
MESTAALTKSKEGLLPVKGVAWKKMLIKSIWQSIKANRCSCYSFGLIEEIVLYDNTTSLNYLIELLFEKLELRRLREGNNIIVMY